MTGTVTRALQEVTILLIIIALCDSDYFTILQL